MVQFFTCISVTPCSYIISVHVIFTFFCTKLIIVASCMYTNFTFIYHKNVVEVLIIMYMIYLHVKSSYVKRLCNYWNFHKWEQRFQSWNDYNFAFHPIFSRIQKNWRICHLKNYSFFMPPSCVTEKLYCFPHCQLIFSFDRYVIYHLKDLREYTYIPNLIPSVCLYHDLQTKSWSSFLL